MDATAKCKKAEKHGRLGDQHTEEDDGRPRRVVTVKASDVSSGGAKADESSEELNFSSESSDSDRAKEKQQKRKRKHGASYFIKRRIFPLFLCV